MKHALFSIEEKPKEESPDPFLSLFGGPRRLPEGEQWKEDEKVKAKVEEVFVFQGFVEAPKEVAELVRRAPLKKYVLFRGEFSEIRVAMPVFVDGKSLDTLDAEWA